jgi:hypothetical protein
MLKVVSPITKRKIYIWEFFGQCVATHDHTSAVRAKRGQVKRSTGTGYYSSQ